MAHVDPTPAYLGRLHMRFPKGYNPASSAVSPHTLSAAYRKSSNIRSQHKGNRGRQPGSWSWAEYTSGIPIIGGDDAADRLNWSVGHTAVRNDMTDHLIEKAKASGETRVGVSAENSHALGHADYGTDHELSAPPASKAQNTEQLAIELGMREAAQKLNAKEKLTDGTSLVHAKITDVLHPQTGHLIARRYKLIRRSNAADMNGKVVFDHMMDGERLHISKTDAVALGKHAHDALMDDGRAEIPSAKGYRKGIKGVPAPTGKILKAHQAKNLEALRVNRRKLTKKAAVKRKHFETVADREGVDMVGSEFTEVTRPGRYWGVHRARGQVALNEQRARMAQRKKRMKADFLTSGSLPADDKSKLMQHVGTLQTSFGAHLGSVAASVVTAADGSLEVPDPQAAHDHIAGKFNSRALGVDDQKAKLLGAASGSNALIKKMEGDDPGSGLGMLTLDQQKLVLAANAYHQHF